MNSPQEIRIKSDLPKKEFFVYVLPGIVAYGLLKAAFSPMSLEREWLFIVILLLACVACWFGLVWQHGSLTYVISDFEVKLEKNGKTIKALPRADIIGLAYVWPAIKTTTKDGSNSFFFPGKRKGDFIKAIQHCNGDCNHTSPTADA